MSTIKEQVAGITVVSIIIGTALGILWLNGSLVWG